MREPRKTERMALGPEAAARRAGARTTDLMGAPPAFSEPAFRDTIREPAQLGVEAPDADDHRRTLRHPRPVSDRREAYTVVAPAGPSPVAPDLSVDVSRADPRRAPTRRIGKRPAVALERDLSLANVPPARVAVSGGAGARFWLAALAVLASIALVLLILVLLRERLG
jgi:hypothetical protein